MNEQAGPACALSVLIVGFFAVLLHDKERSSSRQEPSPPPIARDAPKPRDPEPVTPSSPSTPRLETNLVAPAPKNPSLESLTPRAELAGTSGDRKLPGSVHRIEGLEGSGGRREPLPNSPTRTAGPRGDFTVVEPGETLADVAERVYGSDRAAESLWKANRDQLASIESPLPKGTLLRTP
jgi:hypothetical protein